MNDLETKVIKHDEQIKTLFNSVSELKSVTNEINKLAISIEKIAINQTTMIEESKQLKKDVDAIKEQSNKDAHDIKMTILKCIITGVLSAIVGAIMVLIIKG